MAGSGSGLELADHVVRFYDDDRELGAVLVGYIGQGLSRGEHVVLVASAEHVDLVAALLGDAGFDVVGAQASGQYVALDAQETLAMFMVGGAPDPERFLTTVGGIVDAAAADGSNVRIFGEMVALLWDEGNVTAAMALESLWNALAGGMAFRLLCAYPTSVLSGSALSDIDVVCHVHGSVQPPLSYLNYSGYVPEPVGDDVAGRQRTQVFVPAPESVAAVRRFVSAILREWGSPGLVADAALVASELATNAVTHATSPFRAFVHRTEDTVLVGVRDLGRGHAVRPRPEPEAVHGRGLAIVESLSQRSGIDALSDGKFAWAEFPAESPLSAARRPSF